MNAATHEVLGVARLDLTGQRQPVSDEECTELIGHEAVDEVMQSAQNAFEAGVAEGLGEAEDEDDIDADALLSTLLLSHSIQAEVLPLDTRRTLLRRLLLRSLLRRRLPYAPSASQQRRKPIPHESRNGSTATMGPIHSAREHMQEHGN
jgi:hypothetical protein